MDIRGPKRPIIQLIALTKSQPHSPPLLFTEGEGKYHLKCMSSLLFSFGFLSDTLAELCTSHTICHFRAVTSNSSSSLSRSSHDWREGKQKNSIHSWEKEQKNFIWSQTQMQCLIHCILPFIIWKEPFLFFITCFSSCFHFITDVMAAVFLTVGKTGERCHRRKDEGKS